MQNEKLINGRDEPDVWKGLAAGLIGGLVASWTMNQFQAALSKAMEGFEKPHGAQSMQPSEGENATKASGENKEEQDDATVKAARAVSEGVFGHELKDNEKRTAGAAVHYALAPRPADCMAPSPNSRQRLQQPPACLWCCFLACGR